MKIILLLLISINLFSAYSTTYYVNDDAAGANNGLNWNDAYNSFQDALDIATSGDEIWVAAGTYKPSYDYGLGGGARYNHFRMKNGVSIYGGFAGTETAVSQRTDFGDGGTNETILSGDYNNDDIPTFLNFQNYDENAYHIFYHPSGLNLNNTALLDGFTIRSANSDGVNPHDRGGGIYNNENSISINNVIFKYSYAGWGGAGFTDYNSNSIINNSQFITNLGFNRGGGIYVHWTSNTNISSSTFDNNLGGYTGGGIMIENSSNPTIKSCFFTNNHGNGSEIFSIGGCNPTIYNSIFFKANGTPLWFESSNVEIINCTITKNTTGWQGTIKSKFSTINLRNSICYANNSSTGDEFDLENNSTLNIYNSCYSNNSGYLQIDGTSSLNTTISINNNPQFVDEANDDYRLSVFSPCIDIGNNSYNSETYDLRGTNFERKLNKYTGQSGTIDLGSYEFKAGVDGIGVFLTLNEYGQSSAGISTELVVGSLPQITSKGIVLDTLPNPTTLSFVKKSFGSGNSNFEGSIDNLAEGTTYYGRTFITNSDGTIYSNEISFRTSIGIILDGNQDNIADSLQENVYTFLDIYGNNYITLESQTGMSINSFSTNELIDDKFVYPFGQLEFKIYANQAQVRIIFHGVSDLSNYIYRKLYPDNSYKQFENVVFSTETIGGNQVAVATLTLTDGGPGDYDGIVNGVIYDPGGPALPITANIPIWDWWYAFLLIPVMVYFYKRFS